MTSTATADVANIDPDIFDRAYIDRHDDPSMIPSAIRTAATIAMRHRDSHRARMQLVDDICDMLDTVVETAINLRCVPNPPLTRHAIDAAFDTVIDTASDTASLATNPLHDVADIVALLVDNICDHKNPPPSRYALARELSKIADLFYFL